MRQSSVAALKSVGCLFAIPVVVYAAVALRPVGLGQVAFWLVGAACLIGCFVFLNAMLDEHGVGWMLLVPGALGLCATGIACYVAFLSTAGSEQSGLVVAILILGLGSTLRYNIKKLGALDGLIVTIVQLCFALLVMAIIILIQMSSSKSQKSGRE